METDASTGRVQPRATSTQPTNADQIATTETGDRDINTNGAVKSFSVTQASFGNTEDSNGDTVSGNPPLIAPRVPEFPSGTTLPSALNSGINRAGSEFDTEAINGLDFGISKSDTAAQQQSGTAPPASLGAVAAVTAGVAAGDDSGNNNAASTSAAVNAAANSNEPIKPQNNILDQYASYTYGISVYLMTPEGYKRFVVSKKRTLNGSNLLFQSGGAPVSGTQTVDGITSVDPVANGRNPYFDVDFYIDSLSINTAFPGKQTQAAHMASELKFTVIEPNGITLLDRMYAAVQDHVPKDGAGKVNYTAVQYLMAIRWYGWDIDGNLVRGVGQTQGLTDPNAVVEKFIPFRIRKIDWSVTNKLVTYDFVCAPVGQFVGGGQAHATIPYDIELTDSTVGGLLGGDTQYGTAAPPQNPGVDTSGRANAAADPRVPGNAAGTPAAPQKANAAPSSKPTIRQGLMGAMNDFQRKLVQDKKYEYANHYEIVFANGAESIRDASIIKPENEIKNLAATPMGKPATSDPNSLDPRKNLVDNTLRNSAITAGQQLLQVIELTIRNSTYITQQARVVNQEEEETPPSGEVPGEQPEIKPATAKINWFNITMEAIPRTDEYDYKRNDFAYDIRYIISPYVVVNFDSKYFPIARFNGLHKSYKYWFTGENTAVLDYQANFNSLYNMTISGSDSNFSPTEAIRRKYTSSMRDIPTYVYQAASSESNFGANGRGNEVSANAAEYLYSPSDMGQTKMRIVGDPAWIQQGSLASGVNTADFDYRGFLPDGTINFDSQQVMFEIAWQRPEDYDINTGLADPYSGAYAGNPNLARQAIQSYVYQATSCVSEFRQGKFEQTINGSLYMFPIPQQQNAATTKAASVSVDANGVAERSSALTTTAGTVIPGAGPQPAPPSIDAVQLSASSAVTTAINTASLARQTVAPTTSNGADVQTVNLPPPRLVGDVDFATNEPNQQGRFET